jgi:hypothetical protein
MGAHYVAVVDRVRKKPPGLLIHRPGKL